MLAYSDFSFLDLLSKLIMPGVSILLSTLLALHAIRRADRRERGRRNRDELVALANEFMELAKKPVHELGVTFERYGRMPAVPPANEREAFVIAQNLFKAESVHLTNKLRLLGRSGLIISVDGFSLAAKHAYKRVSDFGDSRESPAFVEAVKHAIAVLPLERQMCFERFMETLHREEDKLNNGLVHCMRLRIGATIAFLRRHFGWE